MTNTKDIPVLLITGYLGSGKTTLLNHILCNEEGVRLAVIVNDIGEINIDAELLEHRGMVSQEDVSLVALQNGCICCTLQNDLVEQVLQLMKMERFDYIVIEASGVCDPSPIAKTLSTIPMLGRTYTQYGNLRLDCITTVVDALRMRDEFDSAARLVNGELDEEDIEHLLIQQIEFCNLILLNKASEVTPGERARIRSILKALQPEAEIIECDYGKVALERLVNTHLFNFGKVASSAGWIREMGKTVEAEPAEEAGHGHAHEEGACHCHHHHHHHHHDEGEAEEYGISSFVYFRRRPFDAQRFDRFVAEKWPRTIIRAKGICYFSDEYGMSYVFEQAGMQKQMSCLGPWYASFPEEDIAQAMKREPGLLKEWDEKYGDRMQKLVFIGQKMDREQLVRDLDACLEEE